MNSCRDHLKTALKEVQTKYFNRDERDFCYQLYHQFQKKDIPKIEITAETPKRGFEIPKNLLTNQFFRQHFYCKENLNLETNKFNRTPDFLFHDYYSKNKQLLAIEIKPLHKSINLILTDIAKLLFYTESGLRFQTSVLILFSEQENRRKTNQIQSAILKHLNEFPKIEIWIAYPQGLDIIWAGGKAVDFHY